MRDLLAMAERANPALSVMAERFRKAVIEPAKASPPPEPSAAQMALWEEGEPWRGRLGPDVPIRCRHFGSAERPAIVPLKTCLQRQAALWPAKAAPIYGYCATCQQGLGYKVRAAYSAEEDWASRSKSGSRRYQSYRKDAGIQRRERRTYIRSQPDRILSDEAMEERPPDLDPGDDDVKSILGGGK